MNLESAVKFHSPKTQKFTDSPHATASDSLSGTDVMAAFGMAQSRAPLGFSAFSGKMNLSEDDKRRSVQMLMQYGLKHCGKVAALRKLDTNVRGKVVQTLAMFAYQDYCRSAESHIECRCCSGSGMTIKKTTIRKVTYPWGAAPYWASKSRAVRPSDWESWESITEEVKKTCGKCSGKGKISTCCVKCKGRGVALDRKKTEQQGALVYSSCKQCSGRGYERIPAASCYRAISNFTGAISPGVWDKSVKPFYESLILELELEESHANAALSHVTSKV